MVLCEICGNEWDSGGTCPFCGAYNSSEEIGRPNGFLQRTVNLEAGRPQTAIAVHKMLEVLDDARRNNVSVVTFIHGYGSSGTGGALRRECRKTLDYLWSQGRIRAFIPGEMFRSRSGPVKQLIRRWPALGKDKNLNRGNRGITIVIIS